LTSRTDHSLAAIIGGEACTAELLCGKLHWSDGDIWHREACGTEDSSGVAEAKRGDVASPEEFKETVVVVTEEACEGQVQASAAREHDEKLSKEDVQNQSAAIHDQEVTEGEAERANVESPFVNCTVVRNKDTNSCKGYCFLSFESLVAAQRAMEVLNTGVTIAGAQIQAQISQPKERHAKPKDQTENITDLRLRRQRYQCASTKKIRGHVSCSDTKATIATKTGRVNAVGGTRGGTQQVFEDAKMSSRSGFEYAK
jgi:RNA recognition motif-containing protein